MSSARSKYRAAPVVVDGYRFASKAEAAYYGELRIRERIGEVCQIELQPAYPIEINGMQVCTYKADFRFWDVTSSEHRVVDVKGYDTPVSRLKRKLVRAVHGVDVEVVPS